MSMGELVLNNNVKPKKKDMEAFWENVIRLYKVNLQLRKKLVIYTVIAGIVLSFLSCIFWILSSKDIYSADGFPNVGGVVIFIAILAIVCTEQNIFDNDEISMLPGNVASRVLSRIMCDLSMIIQAAICDAAIHLASLIICFVLKNLGVVNIAAIMFDWKGFLCKLVYAAALCVAVYMLFAIIYGLLARFGIIRVLIVTGVLIVTVSIYVSANTSRVKAILSDISGFLSKIGAYNNILLVLAVIIVMSAFVWLISKSVHEWKKEDKRYIIVGLLIAYYIIIPVTLFLYWFPAITDDMYDGSGYTLEKDIKEGKVLYKDDIISVGKVSAAELNKSYTNTKQIGGETLEDMGMSIYFCEYNDAKRGGLIPADTILADGQMYIRTIASNEKYNDKYIYQNFIDSVKFTIDNGEYNLSYDKKIVLVDNYMGIFDIIVMGDDQPYFSYDLSGYSTTYIVYRANDIKDKDNLMDIGGDLRMYLP